MQRHCHILKSGLFSIISKSILSQSGFLCNTDFKINCFGINLVIDNKVTDISVPTTVLVMQ